MEGSQTIRHQIENCLLTITFLNQTIEIVLEVNGNNPKVFKKILTNNSLTKQLEENLGDVEIIFQFLKQKQIIIVDREKGKLLLQTPLRIHNVQTLVISEINLEEVKSSKKQAIKSEVFQYENVLRANSQKITPMQINRDNIQQKAYEEIRLIIREEIQNRLALNQSTKQKISLRSSESQNHNYQNSNSVEDKIYELESKLEKTNQINEDLLRLLQSYQNIYKDQITKKHKKLENQINLLKNEKKILSQKLQSIEHLFSKDLSLAIRRIDKLQKQVEKSSEFSTIQKCGSSKKRLQKRQLQFSQEKIDKKIFESHEKGVVKFDQMRNSFHNFTISNSQIGYFGPDKKWTMLVGQQSLDLGNVYKYKVLLQNTPNIKIGVCDKSKVSVENMLTKRALFLNLSNGTIYYQKTIDRQHLRYKENSYIFLQVDLIKNRIIWSTNRSRAVVKKQLEEFLFIKNTNIALLICMYNHGSKIKLSSC